MVHTFDYIHMLVIITRTFICFQCKKASLNSFSDKGLSLRAVVIFGRYDLKFVLLGGILSARLEPTFIKNVLSVSAINFLSVISKCFWYCLHTVLIYFENKAFSLSFFFFFFLFIPLWICESIIVFVRIWSVTISLNLVTFVGLLITGNIPFWKKKLKKQKHVCF